jgi:uncharacterized protein (TIGR03437 family)
LNDYVSGFGSAAGTITAKIASGLYIVPRPSRAAFVVISTAPLSVASGAGECGVNFEVYDLTVTPSAPASRAPALLRLRACDGTARAYQLDLAAATGAPFAAVFRDLGSPGFRGQFDGAGATSLKAIRDGAQCTAAPLTTGFAAGDVVSSAAGLPGLAPGGIASIYGSGFGSDPANAKVEFNGTAGRLVAVFPFQINVQIPESIAPGTASLRVTTANGSAEQPIALRDVAPAIYLLDPGQAAITNQNNQVNTPSNPAKRGEAVIIYMTGLGVTKAQGTLRAAVAPVTVVLGGAELTPFYAGWTPAAPGVYQVNVIVPPALPPGLTLDLYVNQGAAASNRVAVAIQ